MALADGDDLRREYEAVVRELKQERERLETSLQNAQQPPGRTQNEQAQRIEKAIVLTRLRETLGKHHFGQRTFLQTAFARIEVWTDRDADDSKSVSAAFVVDPLESRDVAAGGGSDLIKASAVTCSMWEPFWRAASTWTSTRFVLAATPENSLNTLVDRRILRRILRQAAHKTAAAGPPCAVTDYKKWMSSTEHRFWGR